jgi:hypothetical protein
MSSVSSPSLEGISDTMGDMLLAVGTESQQLTVDYITNVATSIRGSKEG